MALLRWWFETEHLVENADGSLSPFRYYFAQREAVESVIWLYEVRQARDKFDLLRFDASGAVSTGMFDVGNTVGGPILGSIAHFLGYPAMFAITGLLLAVAVPLVWRWREPARSASVATSVAA